MAKRKTLLEMAAGRERRARRHGPEPWHELLRRQSPELLKEIEQLVADWHEGKPHARGLRKMDLQELVNEALAEEGYATLSHATWLGYMAKWGKDRG